jgi:hypothetical protein
MSGTPLNPARLAGLLSTVARSLPFHGLTDHVCKSWEENGAELAQHLAFLLKPAPAFKQKGGKHKAHNLSNFFVDSEKLWVDGSLPKRIDLTACTKDARPLGIRLVLPMNMSDTAISTALGGMQKLMSMKATPWQLKTQVELALSGGDSIFKKGSHYIIYMEDTSGALFPLIVYWNGGQLHLNCDDFVMSEAWVKGHQVCGN